MISMIIQPEFKFLSVSYYISIVPFFPINVNTLTLKTLLYFKMLFVKCLFNFIKIYF